MAKLGAEELEAVLEAIDYVFQERYTASEWKEPMPAMMAKLLQSAGIKLKENP